MIRATPVHILLAWLSVTPGLAWADTPPALPAQAEPAATFGHLRDYLNTSPLDFKTSYVVQGTLATKGSLQFFIQRPNAFRIESTVGRRSYVTISDGKVMTIYTPKDKKFAQLPAPDRPSDGLRMVSGLMGLESAVLRFLDIVDGVAAGRDDLQVKAAGLETIAGGQCEGFTVVETTDAVVNTWKIWLQKNQIPLPCKFEIRSSEDALSSQSNEFICTQPSPKFPADKFVFTPPEGGKKVDVGDLNLDPSL